MDILNQRFADIIDAQLDATTDDAHLSDDDINAILLKINQHQLHIDAEKDKLSKATAYFKKFIDNAKDNFDVETREDNAAIESLKLRLQRYYDANPPKGRKSLKFAGGSFGYNKAQTKYFFNGGEVNSDNAELVKFCYSNGFPEFVKTKEYLDWASLKKNLDFDDPDTVVLADTGEVIDGLRAQKIFSVRTV